jgi:hypothetical protein
VLRHTIAGPALGRDGKGLLWASSARSKSPRKPTRAARTRLHSCRKTSSIRTHPPWGSLPGAGPRPHRLAAPPESDGLERPCSEGPNPSKSDRSRVDYDSKAKPKSHAKPTSYARQDLAVADLPDAVQAGRPPRNQ